MAVSPSARALITLDELKRLSIDPAVQPELQNSDMDDYWQSTINEASDLFYRYCKRPLIYEDATEYYDGTGEDTFRLLRYPVVTGGDHPFTLTEDRGTGAVSLTLGTDLKVRRATGEVVRETSVWYEDVENIVATYRAGFYADVAAVDGDVKRFCVQAAEWLHGAGPQAWGARATPQGVIGPDSLPKPIKDGLSTLRKVSGV